MKPDCPVCNNIKEQKNRALYEDSRIIAFLAEKPCAEGHVLVMTKEHYPIIELVPDYIVNDAFVIANKLSTAIFDSVNCQGTNILVNNGIAAGQEFAHFIIHIIPRKEGDGIDFTWKQKQFDEQEMATAELSLKEESQTIGSFEKEKKEPIKADKEYKTIGKEEENYLTKQLDRIP